MTLKIVTIVGARPQFIKASAVSRVINNCWADKICEVLVHTGQHYDHNMSAVFFDELAIPPPKHNLEVAGGRHGEMTGKMLIALEQVLLDERPDWVLIYGDTNSTLAGALAACKLHVPIAHVEAGLRSFNPRMPEEINRVLADRVSTLLFCPTDAAVKNLRDEGRSQGVHQVGDVMYDVALYYGARARAQSKIIETLALKAGAFALATCHRAENTDDPARLEGILRALAALAKRIPVVLPLHPRTRRLIEDGGMLQYLASITVTEPVPFLDMVALEQSARLILTDSGGVQKEAFFYGVPCVTMRDETEWVETVSLGWNRVVGASADLVYAAASDVLDSGCPPPAATPYGCGDAAERIVSVISGE